MATDGGAPIEHPQSVRVNRRFAIGDVGFEAWESETLEDVT
jgi:hypothetical protein